jgi:tetratricopeptide (TPR) repeat protein
MVAPSVRARDVRVGLARAAGRAIIREEVSMPLDLGEVGVRRQAGLTVIALVTSALASFMPAAWAPAAAERAQQAEPAAARALERQALDALAAGRQRDAERLLEQGLQAHADDPDLVFLRACCKRSRFLVEAAHPLFARVVELDPGSVQGRCAGEVLQLDARRDVEAHFVALEALADGHPDDPLLRWMVAVQCRALDRNEEGVAHYRQLLHAWQPGPSLVHQTYANLLSELGQEEAALVERRIAVEQEPAGWSLHGLGNTLVELGRYEEAGEAYGRAVEHEPEEGRYWSAWAFSLMKAKRYEESLARCERAAQLSPSLARTWRCWGYCLEKLEHEPEALAKYREALRLDPEDDYSRDKIGTLETEALAAAVADGYVPYGEHDLAQVLGTRQDERGNDEHFLDMKLVHTVLRDLAAHARDFPVRFEAGSERARAERDVQRLTSLLEIVAGRDDADSELLLLMGQLQAMAHNLDLAGSAGQADAYFTRLLRREPEHPQGNYHFGAFLASTATRNTEARPYLEKAAALGIVDAYCSLGMLQLVLEDQAGALASLKLYAVARPEDRSVAVLIETLEAGEVKIEKQQR